MLSKILCIAIGAACSIISVNPPKTSAAATKTNPNLKIHSEGKFLDNVLSNSISPIIKTLVIFQIAAYIGCMLWIDDSLVVAAAGDSRSRHSEWSGYASWKPLLDLKPWHLFACASAIFGCWLRRWSFATLDKFFTYRLSIHAGHKLVVTGPYKYLCHPSYTAVLLAIYSTFLLFLHQGLWPVFLSLLSKWIHSPLISTLPLVSSTLAVLGSILPFKGLLVGPYGGVWAAIALWAPFAKMFRRRIVNEEIMMRQHFGREWDLYASKRWRLIPFVY